MRSRSTIATKLLRILALLLFATTASATAGSISGTVLWVVARASDGLTYVQLNGTSSGHPACATGTYWIIANETSDIGHKQYAMLLLAQATGARVQIWGTGSCGRWPDAESIDGIQILTQ